jgi:hypothetical protein
MAPDNGALLRTVAWARLNQGDVSGARRVLHDALAHVPARRLATWHDFVWLMDDSLRAVAPHLPPEAFDEVRGVGLMRVAEIHWNEGRYDLARASAASARPLLEQRLQQRPADTGRMLQLMTAYGYLGKCAKARQLRERVRAALREDSADVDYASDRLDIALRCGDYAEAVTWVDTLIRRGRSTAGPGPHTAAVPATPAWFRVHPAYAPLRGRPDFERLVAEK